MIADDWLQDKTDRELRVMKNRAGNARAITIFGYVFMSIGFSLLVFLPCLGMPLRYVTNVTDPKKILPLQTYYFYDKDQSPYFELTYAAQALLLVTAGASYTGVDNLLGLLIFHLCGQMENLKERLIDIRQFKTFNSNLAFVVRDHLRLIKYQLYSMHLMHFNFQVCIRMINSELLFFRYFDIVESTFTLLLLGLLLYFGILFCLYGFLIIAVKRIYSSFL